MKKFKFTLMASALLMIFLAAGCKKEENSSIGYSIKATGSGTNEQSSQQPVASSGEDPINDEHLDLSWNVAWMYITQVEFDAELVQFSTLEEIKVNPLVHYEWQGEAKVDLLGGPKVFAQMEIPDGTYQDIEISLTSARMSESYGPNFYLSGLYGPPFGGIPIAVSVTEEFSVKLEFENGTISAQSGNFLDGQIELSLDNLFTGITPEDLDKADMENGWIIISSEHNQDLYAIILANLQVKFFHEDPDSSVAWYFHVRS